MRCQDRLNSSCPDVWKNMGKQGGEFFSFCSVFPAVREWGRWRRLAPGKRDVNPGAEGRGEVCCEPPPEVAARGCTFRLCVSLPVTSLSLVVQQ